MATEHSTSSSNQKSTLKLKKRPPTAKFEISLVKKSMGGQLQETVNLRELHVKLGNGDEFANWIKDRIQQYDFVENKDFILILANSQTKKGGRGGDRRSIEYHGTISMAKELAMVERNEKGKQARQYFIRCEEELKQKVTSNPFNFVELGNNMGQVDVSIRVNQKDTRRRLMYIMARHLRCGRRWIQRLTNEIYQTLLNCPNATARNFREHMNLPQVSAVYLTRDQLEGHVQIMVSGIEQSMLILWTANQNIAFSDMRSFALDQAKMYHKQLLRIAQRAPSALVFEHEYNVVPILPYRERQMQQTT
jgi:phage anti-repressor protein